jgi:DNA-binding response OmpR family regulator
MARRDPAHAVRVLVVDDSPELLSVVRRGLQRRGYEVVVAETAHAARALLARERPDVMILDLLLPDEDGIDVCLDVREEHDLPIIMLTARDAVHDRVAGLRAGADDYLVKPFALEELVARIEAVQRRRASPEGERLEYADLLLDVAGHRVFRDGAEVVLTPTEFRLLETLARRHDRVVPRQTLAEIVWPETERVDDSVLDSHVTNLRRKLEAGGRARLIQTVRGIGFVLR